MNHKSERRILYMNLPDKLPKIELDLNHVYQIAKLKLKGVKGFKIICEIKGQVIRE